VNLAGAKPTTPIPARLKSADLTVVGGAGHVGILLLLAFTEAGYRVNVHDLNGAAPRPRFCRHTSGRRVEISHEDECDRLEPRIIRSSSRRMLRSRSLAMRPRPSIRCSKRTVRRNPGCVQLRFQIFTRI
jgi:hypothetical protein